MRQAVRHEPTPAFRLAAFFLLAYGWSWTFWIVAALPAGGKTWQVDMDLIYLGIPGPLLAALVLLYLAGSSAQRRDFWQRIYQVERLRPAWLLLVLLLYPVLTVVAVAAGWLLNGAQPDLSRLSARLADPWLLLSTLGLTFLLGPLLEEPGWRGYALDSLQGLLGSLGASVALGLLWGLWHLPLFFLPGSYHHALGIGSMGFWLFLLTAVAGSVLITWIYQNNDRSVFAAILFHAVLNYSRDSVRLDDGAEVIRTGLLLFIVVLVVLRCGAGSFRSCR